MASNLRIDRGIRSPNGERCAIQDCGCLKIIFDVQRQWTRDEWVPTGGLEVVWDWETGDIVRMVDIEAVNFSVPRHFVMTDSADLHAPLSLLPQRLVLPPSV